MVQVFRNRGARVTRRGRGVDRGLATRTRRLECDPVPGDCMVTTLRSSKSSRVAERRDAGKDDDLFASYGFGIRQRVQPLHGEPWAEGNVAGSGTVDHAQADRMLEVVFKSQLMIQRVVFGLPSYSSSMPFASSRQAPLTTSFLSFELF